MRKAEIKIYDKTAGWLLEDENGYHFNYDSSYMNSTSPDPISLTLPLKGQPFTSKILFPFFDGLIPEGWLLDIAIDNWKINGRDRFGLLLACCKNTIGAVSILALDDEKL
jgi:serine/threonine-protein kinase HipA